MPTVTQVTKHPAGLQTYGLEWQSGEARLNTASVWWLEAAGAQLHSPRVEGRALGATRLLLLWEHPRPYPWEHDIKEPRTSPQRVKREERERDHGAKEEALYFRIFDSTRSLLFKQEAPHFHLEKQPTQF